MHKTLGDENKLKKFNKNLAKKYAASNSSSLERSTLDEAA